MARELFGQALRYSLIGVALNLAYWLLAAGLDRWVQCGASTASGISYALASVLGYFFHRRITFRSRNPMGAEALRFSVVTGIGMTLAITLPALTPGPSTWAYAAVCVAAPVVNFLVYRAVVYARSSTF